MAGCGPGVLAGWEIPRSPLWAAVRALDGAPESDWLRGCGGVGSAHSVGAFPLCWWGRKERQALTGELMA